MALYKDDTRLEQTNDPAFDADYLPGEITLYSGIYRCTGCGREIVCFEETGLPPRRHHEHSADQGKVLWHLMVYAEADPDAAAASGSKGVGQRCAHPACNCLADKDSKFCSAYCHDAGGTLELSCNCGHSGCADELTHRG